MTDNEGWLRTELRFEAPEDEVTTGVTVAWFRENEVRPEVEVCRAHWHLVDRTEGTPLAELDDIGADALTLGTTAEDLDGDVVLLVEHVQVDDERLRGLDLGLLLVRETAAGLAVGRDQLPVILQAQPANWPDMASDDLEAGQAALARHWRKLGFVPVPGDDPDAMIMAATAETIAEWKVGRVVMADRVAERWPGDEKPSAVLARHREAVLEMCADAGVTSVRVLGAVGRGEDHHGDPVDLLVETDSEMSVLARRGLEQRLAELLGFEVNLFDAAMLSERHRDNGSPLRPVESPTPGQARAT